MSFKGLSSALLLILLAGVLIGVLAKDKMETVPCDQLSESTSLAYSSETAATQPTAALTSVDEDVSNTVEQDRLRNWETLLREQQEELDRRIEAFESQEIRLEKREEQLQQDLDMLATKEAELEQRERDLGGEEALLDEERSKLEGSWAGVQQARVEVAREKRQAGTWWKWAYVTIATSLVATGVHGAMIWDRLVQGRRAPSAQQTRSQDEPLQQAYLKPRMRYPSADIQGVQCKPQAEAHSIADLAVDPFPKSARYETVFTQARSG